MRSVEQLAQAAYEAFCVKARMPIYKWERLNDWERLGWIAAVQAVRAEIEAVH